MTQFASPTPPDNPGALMSTGISCHLCLPKDGAGDKWSSDLWAEHQEHLTGTPEPQQFPVPDSVQSTSAVTLLRCPGTPQRCPGTMRNPPGFASKGVIFGHCLFTFSLVSQIHSEINKNSVFKDALCLGASGWAVRAFCFHPYGFAECLNPWSKLERFTQCSTLVTRPFI